MAADCSLWSTSPRAHVPKCSALGLPHHCLKTLYPGRPWSLPRCIFKATRSRLSVAPGLVVGEPVGAASNKRFLRSLVTRRSTSDLPVFAIHDATYSHPPFWGKFISVGLSKLFLSGSSMMDLPLSCPTTLCTKLWPNLYAAAAKLLIARGSTLGSYTVWWPLLLDFSPKYLINSGAMISGRYSLYVIWLSSATTILLVSWNKTSSSNIPVARCKASATWLWRRRNMMWTTVSKGLSVCLWSPVKSNDSKVNASKTQQT